MQHVLVWPADESCLTSSIGCDSSMWATSYRSLQACITLGDSLIAADVQGSDQGDECMSLLLLLLCVVCCVLYSTPLGYILLHSEAFTMCHCNISALPC